MLSRRHLNPSLTKTHFLTVASRVANVTDRKTCQAGPPAQMQGATRPLPNSIQWIGHRVKSVDFGSLIVTP